ncbi:6-hydroxy-D-nicotine oxidase [Pleurostoma richardsiae]|uniref:6-hydroxy-D-nicotine oxidase n=1 Tax=Pleurostoma richardsiae TaxID=41990 RepID=A0AA38VK27_9PEZI|nr:6-hydroxy-D-nicotine oxidase [Pleurostoma richardsiae]
MSSPNVAATAITVDSLRNDLKEGTVLLPGDAGYEEGIQRWSTISVKRAGAIVQPTTAEEVSAAVKFVTANQIPFAVCGGGHSTAGMSSSDGGLVIDMRRMSSVSVDLENSTITYGGGCTWADVDKAAWEHGLATPGGTVSHTGVGGLVLGGGFGFLSPRHGLTIDVLLSVEMVLADGAIVTASETENPDLFWAARGAGASFGVATKFTSRAFAQGSVYAGMYVYPLEQLLDVVAACNKWLQIQTGDQCVLFIIGYGPPPDRPRIVAAQVFHNGPAAEGEKLFADLLAVGPLLNTAAEVPYPVANTMANAVFVHGKRWQFGAANVTAPIQADVVKSAADSFFSGVEELSKDPQKEDLRGSVIGFELFPNEKVREVAPDAAAFANRGKYFNAAIVMNWLDPGNDAAVRQLKRELAAQIRSGGFSGDEVGSEGVGQYNNYVENEISSAERAFGANAKRLKGLKRKYDPANRFDKPWKLVPE